MTIIVNKLREQYTKIRGARRYTQLFDTITEIKPRTIVEVGTWNGNRAVQMIECARKYRSAKEIIYVGFDLFEGMSREKYKEEVSKWPPSQSEVQSKLESTGVTIQLRTGDTLETLPKFVSEGNFVADFVFIDGGHHLKTVESDWANVEKILKKGSVVIFDDYWPHRPNDGGCKMVVDSLNLSEYKVEVLPITDVFNNKDFGQLVINFAKVTKL